jgi:hypothetical protein
MTCCESRSKARRWTKCKKQKCRSGKISSCSWRPAKHLTAVLQLDIQTNYRLMLSCTVKHSQPQRGSGMPPAPSAARLLPLAAPTRQAQTDSAVGQAVMFSRLELPPVPIQHRGLL